MTVVLSCSAVSVMLKSIALICCNMEVRLTDDQLDLIKEGGKLRVESSKLGPPGRNGVVYIANGESNPRTLIQAQGPVVEDE